MGLGVVEDVRKHYILVHPLGTFFALLGTEGADTLEFQGCKRGPCVFGQFGKSDVKSDSEEVLELIDKKWGAKLFDFIRLDSEQRCCQ